MSKKIFLFIILIIIVVFFVALLIRIALGASPPAAFDSFQVIDYGCTGSRPNLYLQWSSSFRAEYYKYYRVQNAGPADNCPNCGSPSYTSYWVPPGSCDASSCSFQDDNGTINENTGYCYCLRAFNESGSTWATDNPPNYPHPYWKLAPLCPPTSIGVDGTKCGYNKLAWQPNPAMASNTDGYNIYRSLSYSGCGAAGELSELKSGVVAGNCELTAQAGEALITFNPNNGNDALVGWWKMNESRWRGISGEVWDSSGKGNHGRAFGEATTVVGKFQRAGTFQGEDERDYVRVPDDDSLDITNAITIEAWVKFTKNVNANQTIVGKRDAYLDEANYGFRTGPAGELNFYFYKSGQQHKYQASGANLVIGNWYHLAVTYDGAAVKIYKNGALLPGACSVGTCNVPMVADNNNLGIGRPGNFSDHYFRGLIDNVAIYNYAKSAAEILKDAEAFPLETAPSGNNNTCSVGAGTDQAIPVYCSTNNNPSSCADCTGGDDFCLSCASASKCCRFIDKRVMSNTSYFYRVTTFIRQVGESPGSSIPDVHSSGCLDSSTPSYYRRACDKSICRSPIKIEEK